MKYCIDTSALVDLGERHYPERLPVFRPIWDYIYDGIDSGEIISVDYVSVELEKKADDWRDAFFARSIGMFQISTDIEKEYANLIREIESRAEFRTNKNRERFLIGADPWVIALARHVGRVCSACQHAIV